jgi:surface protein
MALMLKMLLSNLTLPVVNGGKGWFIIDNGISPDNCGAFVTKWNLSIMGSGTNQISFNAKVSTGSSTYFWEEVSPGTSSGSGILSPGTSIRTISGLPSGSIIRLIISPINFQAININASTDVSRLVDIENWGIAKWTSMESAFYGCNNLNISATDVPNLSGVLSMAQMFGNCTSLNGPTNIGLWNTSSVTNMGSLFYQASNFNQNIGTWNTSSVQNMYEMFSFATAFNQNIGSWDVSSVVSMENMFTGASLFNHNIGNWNTANVLFFNWMFHDAISFNQNLGTWSLNSAIELTNMLNNCGMDCSNYSATLIGWNATAPNNLDLGAFGIAYGPQSVTARANLVLATVSGGKGWNITDAGITTGNCGAFVTRWNMTTTGSGANQLSFGVAVSGTVHYDWQEISPGTASGSGTFNGTTLVVNGLPSNSILRLRIYTQNFRSIEINNNSDKNRLLNVEQWGNINWASMENAFSGCENLNITATDLPILTNVNNMSQMFKNCSSLNGPSNINNWNTSNVNNMYALFNGASSFNQNIANWNTSSVNDMGQMFRNTNSFNQNIGSWDVSNVSYALGMFMDNQVFNQDLSNWDVNSMTDMSYMFEGCYAFNQSLEDWSTKLNSNVVLDGLLNYSGLSIANYDATLIAFNSNAPSNLNLGATNLKYCQSANERNDLINNKGWTISGDILAGSTPAIVNVGVTLNLTNLCGNAFLNPINTSQKMIAINPNGNSINMSTTTSIVTNAFVSTLPTGVTSVNSSGIGYYEINDGINTFRISRRLYTVQATGNYTTNGGVKVRVYLESDDTAKMITDAVPYGSIVTYGWFKSSLNNFQGVVNEMQASFPSLFSAEKIKAVYGDEGGVKYAEFMVQDFSTFGFYAQTQFVPLPVTLSKFDAVNHGCNQNIVSWQSSEDENFSHFELQWSNNNSEFKTIFTQKVTGGHHLQNYQFAHSNPSSNNYYRLKLINKDSTSNISHSIEISACRTVGKIQVTPNPFLNIVYINNSGLKNLTCKLYSMDGKLIAETMVQGNQNKPWELDNLSSGMYLIRFENNGQILKTEKLLKN